MFSRALATAFIVFVTTATLQAEEFISINNYIDRYKDIAISEMDRTGIPASIKLGQAIMESQHGNSDLAQNSNNHFGIKCKKEWTGKKYYHKDDDYDRRGRLIKSCFRVYGSVMESYIDHSEFLLTRPRYSLLFANSRYDYKSWALGLKEAGYATAKHYANTLIKTIENNNLTYYDKMTNQVLATKPVAPTFEIEVDYKFKKVDIAEIAAADFLKELDVPATIPSIDDFNQITTQATTTLKFINGLPAVKLSKGINLHTIAKQQNTDLAKLNKYNELTDNNFPIAGQYIYLKKKKKSSNEYKEHTVGLGETLYDVSQLYGIQLKHLAKINGMKTTEQPPIGKKLNLQ